MQSADTFFMLLERNVSSSMNFCVCNDDDGNDENDSWGWEYI